jgi:hypothetical protein
MTAQVIHHDFAAPRRPAIAPRPLVIEHDCSRPLPSKPRDAAYHLVHFSDDYHFDTIISVFPEVAEDLFAQLGLTRDEFIDAAIARYLPSTPAKD